MKAEDRFKGHIINLCSCHYWTRRGDSSPVFRFVCVCEATVVLQGQGLGNVSWGLFMFSSGCNPSLTFRFHHGYFPPPLARSIATNIHKCTPLTAYHTSNTKRCTRSWQMRVYLRIDWHAMKKKRKRYRGSNGRPD